METSTLALLFVALAILLPNCWVQGSDPDPIQDFCVADGVQEYEDQEETPGTDSYPAGVPSMGTANNASGQVSFNAANCKDPIKVSAKDFVFHGLRNPGVTENKLGSAVTLASFTNFFALNTLGLSLARIDFGKKGVNPPHIHQRASELLFVLEGKLNVGFVSTDDTLFSQTLDKGDLFIFPRGLLHFQQNVGNEKAIAISALDSQNPGLQVAAQALLGTSPLLSEDVLEKTLQLKPEEISKLQAH